MVAIVYGLLAFALILQLLSEVIGGLPVMQSTVASCLVLLVGFSRLRNTRLLARPIAFRLKPLLIAAGFSVIWVFFLTQPDEALLRLLGYGYDNAAHFMQGRILMLSGGSQYLSIDHSLGPSFLQTVSQAPSSLWVLLDLVAGGEHLGLSSNLSTFAATTASIPLLTLVVVATCAGGIRSAIASGVFVLFGSLLFLTGYLSRVWFSGYLGSNLGTLCLICLTCLIAATNGLNLSHAIYGLVITVHFYPVFLILALALVVPLFAGALKSAHKVRWDSLVSKKLTITGLFVVTAITSLVFPFIATRRGYGASHFLVDGGIEPFPSYLLISYVALAVVASVVFRKYSPTKWMFATPFAILTVAGGVAAYSYFHINKLSYYPIKVLIAAAMIICAWSMIVSARLSRESRSRSLSLLVALLVVGFSSMANRGTIFTTGYMGTAPVAINWFVKGKVIVVDSRNILLLADVSKRFNKPILYLSSEFDSELNTRWINSLSRQWTDNTWSSWMAVRQAITLQSVADNSLSDYRTPIVVTSDDSTIDQLRLRYRGSVCLLQDLVACESSLDGSDK